MSIKTITLHLLYYNDIDSETSLVDPRLYAVNIDAMAYAEQRTVTIGNHKNPESEKPATIVELTTTQHLPWNRVFIGTLSEFLSQLQ